MSIEKLKKMEGVEVEEANDEGVYRVTGPGYTMLVSKDDEETLENLTDPKLHKERVKALKDG